MNGDFVDQKTERNMVIAGVDHHMSALLQKRNARGQLFGDRKKLTLKKQKIEDDLELANTDLEIPENEDYETLEDVSIPEPGNFIRTLHRNNNQYPTVAEMADRFNSSNREVAALVNAALKDLNLLTTDNTLIHSKVFRERQRAGNIAKELSSKTHHSFSCLMYNGRRDKTNVCCENINPDDFQSKEIRSTEIEEHYTIIEEPGSRYVDHLIPISGKANDIARELLSLIHDNESFKSLQALGCYGCPANTGKHSGIIRSVEVALDRPLQWLVCMLHLN